jgi:hypothetical protein
MCSTAFDRDEQFICIFDAFRQPLSSPHEKSSILFLLSLLLVAADAPFVTVTGAGDADADWDCSV